MLVELVLVGGGVALGLMAIQVIRRRREASEGHTEDHGPGKNGNGEEVGDQEGRPTKSADAGAVDAPTAEAKAGRKPVSDPPEEPEAPIRTGPRGLRTGDVILYADTELWLAGEVHLDEEGFALSLFPTPGTSRAAWVAQLDAQGKDVAFLDLTDEVPDGAVPTELPIEGMRVSLRRKGQAIVRSEGEHLPLLTERARYVLLGGPGGKTLVVVDFEGGDRLALFGERMGKEMFDLLPGGD